MCRKHSYFVLEYAPQNGAMRATRLRCSVCSDEQPVAPSSDPSVAIIMPAASDVEEPKDINIEDARKL